MLSPLAIDGSAAATWVLIQPTTQWTYGAGASWDVFTHAGLRVEWQRFNNVGGQEVGLRTDVDLMSLGAYIKF